jgi:hypothetical protein
MYALKTLSSLFGLNGHEERIVEARDMIAPIPSEFGNVWIVPGAL